MRRIAPDFYRLSHSERYFSEAVPLNPQDPVARAIVARILELFAIDAEARRQALSLEDRDALPQQQSRVLLAVIEKRIEIARSTAPLGGALAKGCNYTLTLWNKLTRLLEYPELELSSVLLDCCVRLHGCDVRDDIILCNTRLARYTLAWSASGP
jgi:hypothetical protein